MGLQFLIVDDHPLMCGAIRNNLEMLGDAVRCEPAATLADALRLIGAGGRFDLALLDLNLPDTMGTIGLETIRGRHPGLPVLVMSGVYDRQTIDRCFAAGAAGFVPKTATPERLAAAVRAVSAGETYVPPGIDDAADHPGWAARAPARLGMTGDVRQLGLTERQLEVLRLLLRGLPNKLIGRQLKLAEGTVKVHVSAVLRALGARNRTQAVLAANRLGLRLPD